jgi:NhaP-type Na+/H+ or K+/H+ antiporter
MDDAAHRGVGAELAHALLVIGVVVTTVAALSGWLRGVTLSITVLATLFGLALALTGAFTLTPDAPYVGVVVELALLVTLFSDALAAEAEMLRRHWRSPLRALAVAMPLTLLFVAGFARLLFPAFSWAECLLLSAVLAPTDPVITSVVVGSEEVPGPVRHCLNIESGLNDGLAVPLVAVFMELSAGGGSAVTMAAVRVGEAALGACLGVAVSLGACRLLPRLPAGGPTWAWRCWRSGWRRRCTATGCWRRSGRGRRWLPGGARCRWRSCTSTRA